MKHSTFDELDFNLTSRSHLSGSHPHQGFTLIEVGETALASTKLYGTHELPGSKTTRRTNLVRGFSFLEIVIVLLIVMSILCITIPAVQTILGSYQAAADARSLAIQLALVRMRAGADFTQARLNCDLVAKSCQLEIFNKTTGQFQAEGGAQFLSQGVSFGFGSITTPAGTQTTIQNSANILFNSRGIPVDSTGAATGNYALYLTDQAGRRYAVTVFASGRVGMWQYSGGAWTSQ